jgi:hypothetical protein
MSTPTLIQIAQVNDNPSLAFNSPVTAGSFLFAMTQVGDTTDITDNLNGAWTVLEAGEVSGVPYTVSYFPSSLGGTITVSTGSFGSLFIAEISASVMTAHSPVAGGTASGSGITEFMSASVAAIAGQLLVGYAETAGNGIESAGTGYALQTLAAPPARYALETQTVVSPGNFASDFFTPNNSSTIWGTGILALSSSYSISGNDGASGATVSYSGQASGSVVADNGGNFTIPGLINGTYTITPSLPGRTFTPTSQNVTIASANVTGVNFTENALPFSAGGFSPSFVAQNEGGLRIYVSPGGINGISVNGQFVSVPANSLTYVWVSSNGIVAAGPNVPAGAYAIALVTSGQIQTSGTGNPNSGAYVLSDGVLNIADIRNNK